MMIAAIPVLEQHAAIVVPILVGIAGIWLRLRGQLREIHVLVNSRLTTALDELAAALERIDELEQTAEKARQP